MNLAATWLRRNGWKAFDFQKEVWQAVADGQSGLCLLYTSPSPRDS